MRSVTCHVCLGQFPKPACCALDVQPGRDGEAWRRVTVCQACYRELDPDLWISETCLRTVNSKTTFAELPVLPIALGLRVAAARNRTEPLFSRGRLFAPPWERQQVKRERRNLCRSVAVLDAQLRRTWQRPLRVTKDNRQPHIPLRSCVDRHIYRIHARNFSIGVFCVEDAGFVGIREKFGSYYLFAEYHWDLGANNYGTVTPLADLGPLPAGLRVEDEAALFTYLDNTYHNGSCAREREAQRAAYAAEEAEAEK